MARTSEFDEAGARFLAAGRIAVTGVSRTPGSHGGNAVYVGLRKAGFDVVPINPAATEVEGDPAYPDLAAVPGGVAAVVVATAPSQVAATVDQAVRLGVGYLWMHRTIDAGSVDEAAAARAREAGIEVLVGGCPLMHRDAGDRGHRVMCGVLRVLGRVPR
ncbi:CoA-binding protein [Sanguibacter sp. HDW7]|uniref:CoA-binding protein n=1 Tax=Sanguibacter sp. HDW7 TaxID=2714931 RepID=UPI00140DC26A|nr:CoA-binding protein [Sanguibacter sp. HDW7]QIK83451.1 CoA-binding protein [Sanguibacter sp. HDW7]